MLGRALRKNKGLEEIDLTSNSVMPRSAAVLAHSLCYNETLNTLILDGNVLGKVGAQSLVAKMQRAVSNVHRLRISFKNCDCVKEDPYLFNAATPGGSYTVDLSEPYGQMVIEEAFFLGNYRSGCNITKFEYDGEIVELIRAEKKGEQKVRIVFSIAFDSFLSYFRIRYSLHSNKLENVFTQRFYFLAVSFHSLIPKNLKDFAKTRRKS